MATQAQIAANQANARKSTGPRSVEGKSASRFNALKHGIDAAAIVIPGEDPAEYSALLADYQSEYQPQSTCEAFLLQTMLRADWQARRFHRLEADLYRTLLAENPGATLAAALLTASPAAKLLARVQRQIAALERTWYRAYNEFCRAQKPSEPVDELFAALLAQPSLSAPGELASFPQSHTQPASALHPQPKSTPPPYFIG